MSDSNRTGVQICNQFCFVTKLNKTKHDLLDMSEKLIHVKGPRARNKYNIKK